MPKVAAIVYGEQSGIVRRIVVSDNGVSGLSGHYGPGESIIIVNDDEVTKFDPEKKRVIPSLDECYALVVEKRGKPSEIDRCVIIDDATGAIEAVVLADPYLEAERKPGKTLFQHEKADTDWTIDRGEFKPPPQVDAPKPVEIGGAVDVMAEAV